MRGRSSRWVLFVGAVGGLLMAGCKSPESKRCSEEFESSQQVVLAIDGSSLESVAESLAAVERAREACRDAGRSGEVKELDKAYRQIKAQHDALEHRAQRKKRPQLSPEELAQLEKQGDPQCPQGQGYEHHQSKQLIRCTGPQLVDMSSAQAESYFDSRGYKKVDDGGEGPLRFEYGAESFTFHYPRTGGPKAAPECLVIMGAPGVPWQEVVARATAVPPARLDQQKVQEQGRIQVGGRNLSLALEEKDRQAHVRLGSCPGGQTH